LGAQVISISTYFYNRRRYHVVKATPGQADGAMMN
jgi:hypothetical protein